MQTKDILNQCTVQGKNVKLPNIQLDRNAYLDVKKSLELIGGKWKGGKIKAFVFEKDPTELLDKLCQGEQINLKKEFQFFATPKPIADRLVELADIHSPGHLILEPSAGQGAIVESIHEQHPNEPVYCYELMDLNRTCLEKIPYVDIIGEDFLNPDGSHPAQKWKYDRIIANPPFSKNQDIEHVYEMYRCLNVFGRLVSIMSNHWRFTSGKKEADFQKFIQDTEAEVYEIEAGAFKESGTNISACIVVIDNDKGIKPPVFKRTKSKANEQKQVSKSTCQAKPKEDFSNQPEDYREPEEILNDLIQNENDIRSGLKGLLSDLQDTIGHPKPHEAQKQFTESFNKFTYKFNASEVFIDFVDYTLLVMKFWDQDRDFSYWENKYSDLYPKFREMIELLGSASEGFHDALGDLFMDLVSHGRNGQFFTPGHVCDMMSQITIPEMEDGKTVLDPTCGSGRMLLAAGKRNRNVYLFGNDIDATCCKMAVINLLLNSLQGEIAQMNAITMDYTKSWEVSYRNFQGAFLPIYRVVENKDESVFWKLHMNSFQKPTKDEPQKEPAKPSIETPLIQEYKSVTQLQLF